MDRSTGEEMTGVIKLFTHPSDQQESKATVHTYYTSSPSLASLLVPAGGFNSFESKYMNFTAGLPFVSKI